MSRSQDSTYPHEWQEPEVNFPTEPSVLCLAVFSLCSGRAHGYIPPEFVNDHQRVQLYLTLDLGVVSGGILGYRLCFLCHLGRHY